MLLDQLSVAFPKIYCQYNHCMQGQTLYYNFIFFWSHDQVGVIVRLHCSISTFEKFKSIIWCIDKRLQCIWNSAKKVWEMIKINHLKPFHRVSFEFTCAIFFSCTLMLRHTIDETNFPLHIIYSLFYFFLFFTIKCLS